MTLQVLPEGLTAASAAVEALAGKMASIHAAAAPAVTAVVPPASDAVSLQTATGFSAAGAQHQAMAAQGVAELGRSGLGVGESAASYVSGDAMAASTYVIARGV